MTGRTAKQCGLQPGSRVADIWRALDWLPLLRLFCPYYALSAKLVVLTGHTRYAHDIRHRKPPCRLFSALFWLGVYACRPMCVATCNKRAGVLTTWCCGWTVTGRERTSALRLVEGRKGVVWLGGGGLWASAEVLPGGACVPLPPALLHNAYASQCAGGRRFGNCPTVVWSLWGENWLRAFTCDALQVMDNVVPVMRRAQPGVQQVFRARFSAVSAPEVHAAMVSTGLRFRLPHHISWRMHLSGALWHAQTCRGRDSK